MRRIALLLRALLFYIGLGICTVLYAPLGLILYPLPLSLRYQVLIETWTRFILWWLKCCCRLDYQLIGRENIPERPGIVLCKHQSAFETLVLQRLFTPQVWVLKKELLRIPLYGWGLASLGPIAIDRRAPLAASRQLLEQGCAHLARGHWVVIFPEGTRVAPGEHRPYQPGGAVLACRSGTDITPVSHNAGHLWPRNSFVKTAGTVQLVIGPPIPCQGKSARQLLAEVEQWIETTAAALPNPRLQDTTP